MLIEQVNKLPAIERFLYWVKERHSIYLKRQAGHPKPWTDDTVLQSYFFTNPYRENDKVTVWFRENIREPLRDNPAVLFATVAFRWFNLPSTGQALWDSGLLTKWNEQNAVELLSPMRDKGPIFTGAYMIKAGNGEPGCKLPQVCGSISKIWSSQKELVSVCKSNRMELLWKELKEFPYLGPFMSYEVVCDLRYTKLLEQSTDKETWTNLGPGAHRGLSRVLDIEMVPNKVGKKVPKKLPDRVERLNSLMFLVRKKLPNIPKFEMREVEHSLCEFDKYERARLGDGRLKRIYKGL